MDNNETKPIVVPMLGCGILGPVLDPNYKSAIDAEREFKEHLARRRADVFIPESISLH